MSGRGCELRSAQCLLHRVGRSALCTALLTAAMLVALAAPASATEVLTQNWEHGLASEVPASSENDPLTGTANQWLVFSGGSPGISAQAEPGQGTQDTEQAGNDGTPGWPVGVKFFGQGGKETSDNPESDRHNFWHVQLEPQKVSIDPFIVSDLISLPPGDTGSLPAPPAGGKNVAWFGSAGTGTFCGTSDEEIRGHNAEGAKNGCESLGVQEGEIVSPPFSLAGAVSAVMHFNSWFEVEGVAAEGYDIMEIDYTTNAGTEADPFTWHVAGTLNPSNSTAGSAPEDFTDEGLNTRATWQPALVNLAPAIGSSHVRVRFVFDTGDPLYNGFRGWLIDNVRAVTPSDAGVPEITAVDTCHGTEASAATVIHGNNFAVGSTVMVDGAEEPAQTPSSTRIEIPALSPGAHTVQVLSPKPGPASNEFHVTQPNCTPAAVELSPATSEGAVGSSVAYTATVTERGVPLSEVEVTFTVTGANPQSATVRTDEAGHAVFTYTGTSAGSDQVTASALIPSTESRVESTATRTWVVPQPPPPPKVDLPQPSAIETRVGSPFSIVATVTEAGVPQPGVPVTFKVTGANPQTATIASNAAGHATFSYMGTKSGTDHIVASFVDKAGATVISGEVTEKWAAVETKGFKAPVLGKTVNVEPVSGVVYVKLPAGAHFSRVDGIALTGFASPAPIAGESLSKGLGFIPLSEARQIPVGSTLDTTEGVVRLTTATASIGKLQFGEFTAGIFTTLQSRKQLGLTNLNIVDTSKPRQVCATIGKKAQVARTLSKKIVGLLKGVAKGKFTTTGHYSAATVRGTIWNVTDRCDGTLTQVKRGIVSVRDFARRKTITLRAGRQYLAKAP
jgi:Bacterial Ig-like domain (group 1)